MSPPKGRLLSLYWFVLRFVLTCMYWFALSLYWFCIDSCWFVLICIGLFWSVLISVDFALLCVGFVLTCIVFVFICFDFYGFVSIIYWLSVDFCWLLLSLYWFVLIYVNCVLSSFDLCWFVFQQRGHWPLARLSLFRGRFWTLWGLCRQRVLNYWFPATLVAAFSWFCNIANKTAAVVLLQLQFFAVRKKRASPMCLKRR